MRVNTRHHIYSEGEITEEAEFIGAKQKRQFQERVQQATDVLPRQADDVPVSATPRSRRQRRKCDWLASRGSVKMQKV